MTKEMLINTVENQECRIAVLIDGVLEELYVERASSASHVGNIYKGRLTNVEPAIQAAFVDFGLGKNGFLHISDVHPKYFPKGQKSGTEMVGKKRPHRDRPPIQECLRRGQEVVVQMTKEGIGTKGPTLTTYLSVPGRLLVMMPGMSRLGVSRKVEDDDARGKAREILAELNPPDDMGFIVRTAGLDRPKKDLQRDMNYLLRLWQSVKHRIRTCRSPSEIYQESDLVIRTLRDVYNSDIDRIVCDHEGVAKRVQEFLEVAMPRSKNVVELYTGRGGLFYDAGVEAEIEKIYSRRVELPLGGSLVIDQAEALVAIDVNSGRFREHSDAETTATKINLMAAREIARQLRLRDLGGVIVMDFIDMREEKNRRSVEKTLREAMKADRAKTKMTKISAFGIIEMTRQRIRPSLQRSIYRTCSHCDGWGLIKSEESVALTVMRSLQRAVALDDVARIEIQVTPSVAHHLTNCERRQIAELEQQSGQTIIIQANSELLAQEVRFVCTSARGTPVSWQAEPTQPPAKKPLQTAPLPPLPAPPEEEEEEAEAVAEETQDERALELATRAAATIEEATAAEAEAHLPPVSAETAPAAPAAPGPAQAWPAPQGGPRSAQAAPGGPPPQGVEGEGKRRRRGRRGGRRHKKRQAALAAQTGQPPQAGGPMVQVEPQTPYVPSDEPVQPSQGEGEQPRAEKAAPAAPTSPEEANKVLQAIKDFVDREARKVLQAEQVFADTVRAASQPPPQAQGQPPAGAEQVPAEVGVPAEPAAATAQTAPQPVVRASAEGHRELVPELAKTPPAPAHVPPVEPTRPEVKLEREPEAVPAGVFAGEAGGAAQVPAEGEGRRRTRRGRRGGRRHKKPDAKASAPAQGEAKPQAKQQEQKQKQPAPQSPGGTSAKPRRRRPPRKRKPEGQAEKPGRGEAQP